MAKVSLRPEMEMALAHLRIAERGTSQTQPRNLNADLTFVLILSQGKSLKLQRTGECPWSCRRLYLV